MTASFLTRRLLALSLALGLALTPGPADAKRSKHRHDQAGQNAQGGASSPPAPAASASAPPPATATATASPPASPSPPPAAAPLPAAAVAASPAPPPPPQGFLARHPVLAGLAGGGLLALLSGGPFLGNGIPGLLGVLLQLALLLLAGGLIWTRLRRPGPPTTAAETEGEAAPAMPPPTAAPAAEAATETAPMEAFPLTQEDFDAFERLLFDVQAAWTRSDMPALARLMTPELAGHMEEMLRQDRADGLQNRIEQIQLLDGELLETWRDGDSDFASVAIRWSAIDYTLRRGEVIAGDPRTPGETAEIWTLTRRPGSAWRLSAIQQLE